MSAKKNMMVRIGIVYLMILLLGVAILAKIVYLQVVEGEYWRGQAQKSTLKVFNVEAKRGDILSSEGLVLASSVPFYDIRFDPLADGIAGRNKGIFNKGIDSLCLCLSRLFRDKSKSEYKRIIMNARAANNRNLLIHKQADYEQLVKLKKFPLFRLGRNRGGLIVEIDNRRIYPYGDMGYRTIGYYSKADTSVGIEGSFNDLLRGKDGSELRRKIAGGGWMPVSDGDYSDPVDGLDVVTTLDVRIQDMAQAALRRQLVELGADHGTVIVMETSTGDIKAISNLQRHNGTYQERYNYAIGEAVEPGSTFKLASYMALLEDGYVQPDDVIDNKNGSWNYKGKKFHDDDKEATKGKLTVEQAFALSSNPAIAQMAVRYYTGKEKQFLKHFSDFHLTEPFSLQIAGEGKPFFQNPETKNQRNAWSAWTLPMMSTGYELRLAPIHTLTLYNAVANGGKMVKPRFVKEIQKDGSTVESYPVEVLSYKICSSSTLKKITQMMEAVVEYGTAKAIRSKVYKIAGKTGTAQIAMGTGGYGDIKRHYASFAGFFPAEDPHYSCIVTVYAPANGAYAGAMAAAPVFREISDRIYATSYDLHATLRKSGKDTVSLPTSKSGDYAALIKVLKSLDIPYDNNSDQKEWVNTHTGSEEIKITDRKVVKGLVPNVQDMGLKDALYLLESSGMRVQVRGSGRVRKQSVSPGMKVHKGNTIVIELG
ncbi:MAG: penicillin-binding protein [Bacteroidales bacterium]|nr:penicillin-binding protein [Bacteroidales bacterium]